MEHNLGAAFDGREGWSYRTVTLWTRTVDEWSRYNHYEF